VTVAGTNGKGSCVAMLESIYWHAGYSVGAFTSPHVWRFNERIRVDGCDAGDTELVELFETIEAALGTTTLSYFESSTVAALLHFVRRRVDVAVLEVGMGGRLDASNAIDADCALIVSIDLDHQEFLGNDRDSIGREKAGIMRRDKPVVIADRDAPPTVIGRDFDYERGQGERRWHRSGLVRGSRELPLPAFGGDEQFGNAAACAEVVAALGDQLPVAESALAAGIAHAYLRGRLERHRVDSVEWVFDVAHNPAAAVVLHASIARLPPAKRTLAVFAAMRDKDLAGTLAPFVAGVDAWFVTQANAERGATPGELRDRLLQLGARAVKETTDVTAAVVEARAASRAGDRVLVFGSFHTVGAATATLGLYCAPSRQGDRPATWTRV
jgi:dihydrofolate synthase/folylpolyglutamate synthase